jgi:uncharacterized protein (DUF697 family)
MTWAQQWASHVSRHVDLKALKTQADEAIAVGVCGPNGEQFISALRSAGTERPGSFVFANEPNEVQPLTGVTVKAIIYCPADGSSNGSKAELDKLPYAAFVAQGFDLATLRKQLLANVVRAYRGHETALGAAIPAFRSLVAAKLTGDCAKTCLEIAGISALADHVPLLGLLVGSIASAGDTIAITALQMRLLLRIAATYGKKPEMARVVELAPVVGAGFAWRTLAREVSGFIPIAGIPIKAAIAYAGTQVVGQVAAHYYETGSKMSSRAIRRTYQEAVTYAKELAGKLLPKRSNKH